MGDQQGSGDGSNKLKRFSKIDVNGDHKFLPFEMMGNKHGWLSKVQGPAIQLPVMRVPWDCTGIENQNGQMKAQVSLSFDRDSSGHGKLQDLLEALDDRAVKHIIANKAKIWEGKKVPSDEMIADQMYYRIVKPSNQPDKYGPTMKAKLEVRANTEAASSSSAFAGGEDDAGVGGDVDEFGAGGDGSGSNKRPSWSPSCSRSDATPRTGRGALHACPGQGVQGAPGGRPAARVVHQRTHGPDALRAPADRRGVPAHGQLVRL